MSADDAVHEAIERPPGLARLLDVAASLKPTIAPVPDAAAQGKAWRHRTALATAGGLRKRKPSTAGPETHDEPVVATVGPVHLSLPLRSPARGAGKTPVYTQFLELLAAMAQADRPPVKTAASSAAMTAAPPTARLLPPSLPQPQGVMHGWRAGQLRRPPTAAGQRHVTGLEDTVSVDAPVAAPLAPDRHDLRLFWEDDVTLRRTQAVAARTVSAAGVKRTRLMQLTAQHDTTCYRTLDKPVQQPGAVAMMFHLYASLFTASKQLNTRVPTYEDISRANQTLCFGEVLFLMRDIGLWPAEITKAELKALYVRVQAGRDAVDGVGKDDINMDGFVEYLMMVALVVEAEPPVSTTATAAATSGPGSSVRFDGVPAGGRRRRLSLASVLKEEEEKAERMAPQQLVQRFVDRLQLGNRSLHREFLRTVAKDTQERLNMGGTLSNIAAARREWNLLRMLDAAASSKAAAADAAASTAGAGTATGTAPTAVPPIAVKKPPRLAGFGSSMASTRSVTSLVAPGAGVGAGVGAGASGVPPLATSASHTGLSSRRSSAASTGAAPPTMGPASVKKPSLPPSSTMVRQELLNAVDAVMASDEADTLRGIVQQFLVFSGPTRATWRPYGHLFIDMARIMVGHRYRYRIVVTNTSADMLRVRACATDLPAVSVLYIGESLSPGVSMDINVVCKPVEPHEALGYIEITAVATTGVHADVAVCPVYVRAVPSSSVAGELADLPPAVHVPPTARLAHAGPATDVWARPAGVPPTLLLTTRQ